MNIQDTLLFRTAFPKQCPPSGTRGIRYSETKGKFVMVDPDGTEHNIGIVEDALHGSMYGIVSGDSSDATAAANATALATAITAAATAKKPLILSGTIYLKGAVTITGVSARVSGVNCTLIQKDTAHNGLTLSPTPTAAYGTTIENLTIEGQGSATHDAAAFYGRAAADAYLASDVILRNVTLKNFRIGESLAGISNYQDHNVSIIGCRTGRDWDNVHTAIVIGGRCVQGDGHADSVCYDIAGDVAFANKVIGGEYGGANITRFANVASGILHVEGANLEAFTSAQTINCPGTGVRRISLRHCRIANTYAGSSSAIISAAINGDVGIPRIELVGNYGWAGTPRMLELHGTYSNAREIPLKAGSPVNVTYAATQGAEAYQEVTCHPGEYLAFASAHLPASGAMDGARAVLSDPAGTATDLHFTNPIVKVWDVNAAAYRWISLANDMLARVLKVAGRVANGASETNFLSATIPAGALRNDGESVHIRAYGTTAANGNAKQMRFKVDGTTVLDFGSITPNAKSWRLEIDIQRGAWAGGTGYMKYNGALWLDGEAVIVKSGESDGVSPNAAAIAVLLTGEGTAASDLVCLAAKVQWSRAVSAI